MKWRKQCAFKLYLKFPRQSLKDKPDDAVAQTDDEDQDSGERSFQSREKLGKNHSTLNCGTETHKHNKNFGRKKKIRIPPRESGPTVVSFVTDALVLGVKHGLLQHPQYDDGADPELDPQQVPPVAGAPQQPQGTKQNVHDAHDHEELRQTAERPVYVLVGKKFGESYI